MKVRRGFLLLVFALAMVQMWVFWTHERRKAVLEVTEKVNVTVVPKRDEERTDHDVQESHVRVNKEELQGFLNWTNEELPWINRGVFRLERGFVPIVVRANRRIGHFRHVLDTLRRVERVNRTVLIVSHDALDPAMLREVANIKFMTVKQIVNPWSANVLLDRFPGTDERVSAVSVDRHKNARGVGMFPGIKHHFLWHLAYVWNKLLPEHVEHILLIEEDHLPTFDFYIAARSLIQVAPTLCPTCRDVLMGHHSRNGDHNVTQTTWGAPFDVGPWGHDTNLGLSMSRSSWRAMQDNMLEWCSFDDYNWDLSLERLRATKHIPAHFLSARWSRLYHYGLCGATHESRSSRSKNRPCAKDEADVRNKVAAVDTKLRLLYAAEKKKERVAAQDVSFSQRLQAREARRSARVRHRDDVLYQDDDDGRDDPIHVGLATALWSHDALRTGQPKRHGGWGGFGPADQAFCLTLSGVESDLLPPLPKRQAQAIPALLYDDSSSNIEALLRKVLQDVTATQVGCFKDDLHRRDLGSLQGMVKSQQDCFRRCRVARSPFAGLQFGGECWCGRRHGLFGKVPIEECRMTCIDDKMSCGGEQRNLIFDLR